MNYLRWPFFAQSGVDVTTKLSIKTGCSVRGLLAMVIHTIEFFHVPAFWINGAWVVVGIDNREADDPNLCYPQTLDMREYMCRFATQGGTMVISPQKTTFDPPLLIVEDELWLKISSNITGVANVVQARIGFTWKKITQAEYVEALELMR